MTDLDPTPKQIAYAFYTSYNRKDLKSSFDAYTSDDLVAHALGGTFERAAWLEQDESLFPAFEDFTLTVLDQVAEGDKVATRFTSGGTHTGASFAGRAATGRTAFLTVSAVDRIDNGRIVEHWADMDFSSFLDKLG